MIEFAQEHESTIWINDKKCSATITYIDDGHYGFKPYPNVRLQDIILNPECLPDRQEDKIKNEIEEKLRREFYERQQESESKVA
jgi:hypothetical protein